MDREIWRAVMAAVRRACREVGHVGRRPRYPTRLVVAMYCWAVWHDRCLSWACDRADYGRLCRPRKLPGVSQFCRRVKSPRVRRTLHLLHEQLARPGAPAALSYLDGKLLPVGPHTKDAGAT